MADAEMVLDPYLKPKSITSRTIAFGDVSLRVLSGVQPGIDLDGKPRDFNVRVASVSRQHVDDMLQAVEQEHPELADLLALTKALACRLDTIRDEAKFGLSGVMSRLRAGEIDKALDELDVTRRSLGRWEEVHRLLI